MEGSSTRVWQRQCCTFALSEVAAGGLLSSSCGKPVWPSMTRWKPLHGIGRVSTARCTKHRLRPNAWVPTPRIGGKNGRKRSLLVDGIGVPLSLVASGANTHDVKLLEATLDQLVMEMPGRAGQYNLCADAGYKGAPASNAVVERDYKPHIKQRREEAHDKLTEPGFKARRWVVERTHSWINRFRKLLVSFEKTEASYVALLSLACAMICWRQTVSIYGCSHGGRAEGGQSGAEGGPREAKLSVSGSAECC